MYIFLSAFLSRLKDTFSNHILSFVELLTDSLKLWITLHIWADVYVYSVIQYLI